MRARGRELGVRERVRESGMNRVLERVNEGSESTDERNWGVSLRKGVSVGERDQEKFRRGVRKCDLRERHQWDSGTE